MLKKVYVLIAFCVMLPSVFGQGNFKVGVSFEPSVAWLKSDVSDVNPEKAKLGFSFGVTTDLYFASNYAFATGISLLSTGGTLSYDKGIILKSKNNNIIVGNGENVKYNVRYIKIPLGLRLKTHQIGRMTYFADLGFDPMVKISARADHGNDKNVRIGEEVKAFNIGFHAGGGVEYSLGEEASLIFGLTYMNLFADMTSTSHDKITSNNLLFRIGIIF